MARKPRNLSPDEAELWSKVVSKATPLKPVAKPTSIVAGTRKAAPAPKAPVAHFKIGARAGGGPLTATDLASDISDLVGHAPPAMDRKVYRKMTRGKLRPEARIDLHGMTLAQAHPALISFIMASHAAGRRLVLVITGKGSGSERDADLIPQRRGVLREQVPGWLASAPCKSMVIQVVQAHQSHGGKGAYYVYLRRKP